MHMLEDSFGNPPAYSFTDLPQLSSLFDTGDGERSPGRQHTTNGGSVIAGYSVIG